MEATFRSYKEKVHIIKAYAGEDDYGSSIKLDTILSKYKGKRIFIKMDIEGMEIEALKGCIRTMELNDCVFACTCYHTNAMERELVSFFEKHGYQTQLSNGYMLFIYGHMTLENGKYEKMEYPYFRRGIVRAYR